MTAIKVLLLEDEPQLRTMWVSEFTRAGFAVEAVDSCAGAIGILNRLCFDVLVFDFLLGDGTCIDVLKQARKVGSSAPVLIVSSVATPQDAMSVGGLAQGRIIMKPIATKSLVSAVREVVAAAAAETSGSPFLSARDRVLALDRSAADTHQRCRAIIWRLMSHSRVELPEFAELAELSRHGMHEPTAVAARLEQIHESHAIQDPRVRQLLDCLAASLERDTSRLAQACQWSHEGLLAALRTGSGVDARFWIRMARLYRGWRQVLSGDHLGYVAERAGFSDENQLSRVYRDLLGATVTEIRAGVSLAI